MNAELKVTEIRVPDIGDFKNIPVIEVLVAPGGVIAANDPIVTLESDKATIDVPSPLAGRVVSVEVAAGTRVSCGSLLITINTETSAIVAPAAVAPASAAPEAAPAVTTATSAPNVTAISSRSEPAKATTKVAPAIEPADGREGEGRSSQRIYAGPSVRRMGRELGVDLSKVAGSARSGRVLKEDVRRWVRDRMQSTAAPSSTGSSWPAMPAVDFSKYGEIERQPLSRIRRISGPALARNWATIPHVTNLHEADVTELEEFRAALNEEARGGAKITMLTFLVKAAATALKSMPAFNASLDGQELVLKKYVNIGVAVDTPAGLLVPVLRNADRLGLREIAVGLAAKAALARDGKLKAEDMEGGCFSISSLGGIGGGGFTPIINAPEIAILGAGKAQVQARWIDEQFVPRLILPLSLSWDHRALDGALAARFLTHLAGLLQDFRRVSL
jgi:pyruvate dehydrogenase E2 component (dihydrolipoamide acetyltransferase)